MNTDLIFVYLDPRGRLNRLNFIIYFFILTSLVLVSASLGDIQDPRFRIIVSTIILWPQVALMMKRLHDMNFSGWWLASVFVIGFLDNTLGIIVNLLLLLVLVCEKGTEGENRYGPDPLTRSDETSITKR